MCVLILDIGNLNHIIQETWNDNELVRKVIFYSIFNNVLRLKTTEKYYLGTNTVLTKVQLTGCSIYV